MRFLQSELINNDRSKQSSENNTVTRSIARGRSPKNNRSPMTHPSLAYFSICVVRKVGLPVCFCPETTFLDFEERQVNKAVT